MKDVDGVAEIRSLGPRDGQTEGQTDRITHTWTDEDHFYSLPPPTSSDNQELMSKDKELSWSRYSPMTW